MNAEDRNKLEDLKTEVWREGRNNLAEACYALGMERAAAIAEELFPGGDVAQAIRLEARHK